MKVNLLYSICFIFCLNSCSVSSQHMIKTNELTLLSIADTNLCTILDSVISFEKKCEYYNDTLCFTIDVRQVKNIYELQIGSANDMDNVLNYFKPIFGYLYYQNHLFIIYDISSKKFFSKTKKIKEFKYTKYDTSHQDGDTIKLYNIIDDTFTYWTYFYINSKFVFQDRSSSCD